MARAKTSSKRRTKRKPVARRHPEEPEPVLAGRLLVAASLLAAMVIIPWPGSQLADAFVPKDVEQTDMSDWAAGKTVDVEITLITADYERLGCVLDREIAGKHCEFKTETDTWPRGPDEPLDNNKKDIIQPYSTSPDNKLMLVGGLWSIPKVAMRLHSEPWQDIPEKKLARFIVSCKVRLIEQLKEVTLRWNKTSKWGKQGPAWVGVAESCGVREK
jgi:hypothetical protein